MYNLEIEFSRTLEAWNRTKAKKTTKISFRPAYLLPPEDLPIQGLMMPEPPKRKHEEEREERKEKKTFDPKRRCSRNVRMRRKPRKIRENRRREKALKMESKAIKFLCRCCDYMDKLTGKCLILRLGGECPYINGVYTSMAKKAMKVPVRSR